MAKYRLEIVAFIGGAAVMVLELVGSRILAPYLGTSIIVWTALIGIILASLSLGYFGGGKLADKNPDDKNFSLIILVSSLLVTFTALLKTPFLSYLGESVADLRVAAIVATLFLFAPASVALGMVTPYAVRLKIKSVAKSGITVGGIYAVSTIGSIAGTFSAGFYLIPFFGSTKILYLISAVLLITSVYASPKTFLKIKLLSILVFAVILGSLSPKPFFSPNVILDMDSLYNRIWILKAEDSEKREPILSLFTDAKSGQSSMYLNSDELVVGYTKYYRLFKHFNPGAKRALMIGGGAYSYPKDFLMMHPEGEIDVVELDPEITAVAREYFRLEDSPRLTIYHQDGRIFLNQARSKYDAIFLDAYRNSLAIPHQLTTKEAINKMHDLLNENGVVISNIVSAVEGEKGKFLRAEYLTYRQVFPQVYIFLVYGERDGFRVGNIMLVAFKSSREVQFTSENSEFDRYLKNVWTQGIEADVPILTDDYAPVEQYAIELLLN